MKIHKQCLSVSITVLITFGFFLFSGCGNSKNQNLIVENQVKYNCPMHPDYISDKPGNCPICGMKLVEMEKESSKQDETMPAMSEEKTLEEICIEHKCTMKNCPMMIKTYIKPGERVVCPVCGEVIGTTNGKAVEIISNKNPKESASVETKNKRKLLYYRNPMNPQETSPVAMKDSMGMDYIPVYDEQISPASDGGTTVKISPERQQMIGVQTETVQVRNLTKVILVSGKIAYDPELAITQEEFIQALNAQDNVKDSPLVDIINNAQNLTDASRNKLKLLGMTDSQIENLKKTRKSETNLYLPQPGDNVWAYLSVYEYEIDSVKIGESVTIEAVAYPGEKFSGKVVSVNPVLDSVTRTNQVRVRVINPNNKLKPEMFVNAVINEKLGAKLAIPESAVLDTGLRKIVYLSKPNDILESHEVTLGKKAGNYYEVLNGLKNGDVVVTSGNFLVDSESKLKNPSREK
ncbi:MAG: efflux RND transporter periplasmic adaptor subunit [Endomicrobiaceae bacterium]|nr:efflux RND transporter periplasmic adaptor subunit [Endomicrobiaceae bacterium]